MPDIGNGNYASLLITTANLNSILSWAPNCRYVGSLPAITGQVGKIDFSGSRSFSGAFINVDSPSGDTGATHSGGTRTTVGFDAARSSSVYNRTDNLIIPSGTYCRALIKYI